MEKIKSVNTNYIYKRHINDELFVNEAFENGDLDYLFVKDDTDTVIGIYYLEDFCNSKDKRIEKNIPLTKETISEERRLLDRIKRLSDAEVKYVRDEITRKMGLDCVCCCSAALIAEEILTIIFGNLASHVSIVDRISSLQQDDKVIFLTFRKIKLYRRTHTNEIQSLIALNNLVLDSINRKVFYDKYPDLINNFKQMQVGFVYGIIPEKEMLTCLSKRANERLAGFGNADYEFHEELLGGRESGDYISCMEQTRLSRVVNNGIYKFLEDCCSTYYNVVGGMRVTVNQPTDYENTIYVFGPCTARGALVEDKNTIASILQKMVNEKGLPYIVLNCGVGGGTDLENTYRYIVSLPIKPGDCVILVEEGQFLDETTIDGTSILKLADGFNKEQLKQEWFLDRPAHCNADANIVISNQIIERIVQYSNENSIQPDSQIVQLFKGTKKIFEDSEPLKKYVKSLRIQKFDTDESSVIGSITMHCNPMTKGHKYLIEKALKEVDYLYVFILSEDKSDIPFSLRKQLLVHETSEYSNVKVLDCGKFMASTTTFPEYFTKENNKESRVDASRDILTFCQYVAPTLNITKRFVGTENRDFVTRQYNSQLRMLLPMYGIEVYEIDRIRNSIGFISAYTTRLLIEAGDWEGVSKMVTKYVLKALKEFYREEN